MKQTELIHLDCDVKFRIFEPIAEYRRDCPYVLVTSAGSHTHPIPLPQKTPPVIRNELVRLLGNLEDGVADLTPRRLLRHPVLRTYLRDRFPEIPSPSLSDLHVSLANRAHLKWYINQAKIKHFPEGTGWEGQMLCLLRPPPQLIWDILGIKYMKQQQDEQLDPSNHYIRRVIQIANDPTSSYEDDNSRSTSGDNVIRIVICMSKEGSERLVNSQYLQSDIAFKRVPGFYEFEIAGVDRDANTSKLSVEITLLHESHC